MGIAQPLPEPTPLSSVGGTRVLARSCRSPQGEAL